MGCASLDHWQEEFVAKCHARQAVFSEHLRNPGYKNYLTRWMWLVGCSIHFLPFWPRFGQGLATWHLTNPECQLNRWIFSEMAPNQRRAIRHQRHSHGRMQEILKWITMAFVHSVSGTGIWMKLIWIYHEFTSYRWNHAQKNPKLDI